MAVAGETAMERLEVLGPGETSINAMLMGTALPKTCIPKMERQMVSIQQAME
jgi:hypothetical protein